MPYVHLANIPRHVGWGPRHFNALFKAVLVNGVDIVHPDRHPGPFVAAFVPLRAKRHLVTAFASAALAALAEKDFALARADATERRRSAPVPGFLPSEFFEPGEALLDVRNIQDRRQPFCTHSFPPVVVYCFET